MSHASNNPNNILELIGDAANLCKRARRDDLATVLQAAAARIRRPDTVIAVVGEFKQGKSSLVNGLLGEVICPVDDDIATASVTVVRYGEHAAARIHTRDVGEESTTEVPVDELGAHVVERGRSQFGVALAEVQIPNAFLGSGITLVDSPGVGSLNPGYMAMTLAYVRAADALLFVSDASSPLTRTELDFLSRVRDRCPTVVPVMPKIDLFPRWRDVLDVSAVDLQRLAGLPRPLGISNTLRMAALERGRADLNERSGFPALLQLLNKSVLGPSASLAVSRATADLDRALGQLAISTSAELEALDDAAGSGAHLDELNRARDQFNHLRAGGARWGIVMNDGFADLVADVEHAFRGALRKLTRDVDERIEAGDPARDWEELTADLRERVAVAAEQMVVSLEQGAEDVAGRVLQLLREEDLEISSLTRGSVEPDVARLWLGKEIATPSLASTAGTGYASLRGAQGGILVFGMLSHLAGIALGTMALAGVGIIFGGKQLFEERRRQVATRRQQARTTVRQFLDDVQFAVSKDMRDLSRELQRSLRDHFSERIAEMTRTYAEAAESLQKALQQSEAERESRRKELATIDAEIGRLRAAIPGTSES